MWVCVYCDFVNGLFACGFDVSAFAYYGLVVGLIVTLLFGWWF